MQWQKKAAGGEPPADKFPGPAYADLERENDVPNLHAPTWGLQVAKRAAAAVSNTEFSDLLVRNSIVGIDVTRPNHAGHH